MSLKVWLPLNGSLENKGISNAKIENMGAVTSNASGKIGSCMSFTGATTSYLRLSPILSTGDCSIAFWLKINSHSTHHTLYSQRVTNNASGFTIFHYNGGNLRFDDGSTLEVAGIPVDEWHHVVCCRDSTKKYIYVDGVLKGSAAKGSPNPNTNYALIGGSQNNAAGTPSQGTTNALNGYLNDYRIYDHCLSAAEVHEISQGLVLHYKLDRFSGRPGVNPNLLSGNVNETSAWVADGVTLTKDTDTDSLKVKDNGTSYRRIYNNTTNVWLTSGEKFTVSFRAKGATSGIKLKVSRSVADMGNSNISLQTTWNTYFRTITNTGSGITGGTLSIQTTTDDAVFWIKDIKLEKGTSQTAFVQPGEQPYWIGDSSGYNHNGTIIGNLNFNSGNGRYSAYMRIPDNTGHIQCDVITTSGFSNSYTFAWWGTKSAASTMFWGFQDGIRLNGLYNNTLWNTGDSSNNPIYNIGTTTIITAPTVTEWHHYAMTGNGTKCYLYVDGQLYGEAKTYKSISGTKLWINGWQNSTNYAGYMNISDFRVYCTALDADAIRQLYEVGAKIDNKQNLHIYELDENRSLTSNSTQTLTYTSSSGSYTITTYSTASSSTNQYTSAPVICNSYNYTSAAYPIQLGKKYYLAIESGNTITTYTGSFTPYRWERQGSGYRRVAGSTTYIRFGQILIEIDFYNANDQLIGTDSFLSSRTYNTGSSSYTSQTITGSAKNKTINIPYLPITNTQNTAYIKIREHYRGKSPYSVTKHTTIREYTSSYGIKLFKRGMLDTVFLKEDSNTRVIKPYMVETNNLIEF